jgi:hypothetical protein
MFQYAASPSGGRFVKKLLELIFAIATIALIAGFLHFFGERFSGFHA